MKTPFTVSVALPISLLAVAVHGDLIMPDLANAPADWTTDRYEPTSFKNVGTYQGRDNVLGIEITSAGNLANRPSAYQSTFYNTQGRQHAVTGGAGSVLSADLYIPASWGDPSQGNVRTDIWGVMTDAAPVTPQVTGYPIIGFTNYGDEGARFRIWDDTGADWITIGTPITYDAWISLAVELTASSYVYSINGTPVYTLNKGAGTTAFQAVIMQAYNFADPSSVPGAVVADYTAYWSNTPVPEPSTYLAGALLLAPFGLGAWRTLRKPRQA